MFLIDYFLGAVIFSVSIVTFDLKWPVFNIILSQNSN